MDSIGAIVFLNQVLFNLGGGERKHYYSSHNNFIVTLFPFNFQGVNSMGFKGKL
jgi:hypothetical protein